MACCHKLVCFSISHLNPILIFTGKPATYNSGLALKYETWMEMAESEERSVLLPQYIKTGATTFSITTFGIIGVIVTQHYTLHK